ncbi:MAG TPA: voltage-gated chloride channel family protein [Bdellovibrio sp.]|uniref:voltage-gated chloride channel family protein n=1 Tax=Bdellovibrio sp. TaxID=28201 RepID=UPI002F0A9ED3
MRKSPQQIFRRYVRWSFYSVIIGILSGVAAAIFLISLNWATNYRDHNPWIIWLLPLAGLFIGFCYHHYGKRSEGGTGLILEEIHNPQHIIPFRMAPFVLLGTVITHFFGGSAGREGTAVQMGSTLADQLSNIFHIEAEERKILLIAGAGAGFAAAIGAPLAGTIFGLEVIQIGRLRLFALFECFVASFVAYYTCVWLGAPHSHFEYVANVVFNPVTFGAVILAGAAFGITANLFVQFTHFIEKLQKKYVKNPMLRPLLAGILLVILYGLEGSYNYVGLGIPFIQHSFTEASHWYDPVLKIFFTSLTIGSGFKGGEFVPLVFIGTSLGSFLSQFLAISMPLITALGFVTVFGAAANTPIACAIMGCEIFGWQTAPYMFISCWVAYYLTGHLGIYKNQKIIYSKKDQLLKVFKLHRVISTRDRETTT